MKVNPNYNKILREAIDRQNGQGRLTTREEHPHGAEGRSIDNLTGKYCRGCFEATACVEKLARYEDAEEDGRLILLPCPVGTKIYEVVKLYTYNGIGHFLASEISVEEHEFTLEWTSRIPDFGKKIFLKREEAEVKKREMEQDDV